MPAVARPLVTALETVGPVRRKAPTQKASEFNAQTWYWLIKDTGMTVYYRPDRTCESFPKSVSLGVVDLWGTGIRE